MNLMKGKLILPVLLLNLLTVNCIYSNITSSEIFGNKNNNNLNNKIETNDSVVNLITNTNNNVKKENIIIQNTNQINLHQLENTTKG